MNCFCTEVVDFSLEALGGVGVGIIGILCCELSRLSQKLLGYNENQQYVAN